MIRCHVCCYISHKVSNRKPTKEFLHFVKQKIHVPFFQFIQDFESIIQIVANTGEEDRTQTALKGWLGLTLGCQPIYSSRHYSDLAQMQVASYDI